MSTNNDIPSELYVDGGAERVSLHPYVSIDIETSGLDPDKDVILEFAAVFENWRDPIEKLPHCHFMIHHEGGFCGAPKALAMHGALLEKLAEKAGTARTLMRTYGGPNHAQASRAIIDAGILYPQWLAPLFQMWLEEIGAPSMITIAGHNFGSFDLQFLRKLHGWDKISTFYRYIDPCLLFWNPETDTAPPSFKLCLERAHLTNFYPELHNAYNDALAVVGLTRHVAPDLQFLRRCGAKRQSRVGFNEFQDV